MSNKIKVAVAGVAFLAALGLALGNIQLSYEVPVAVAQTADGETPAEEDICAEEPNGLKGLCNAFCEATDCHLDDEIHASSRACEKLLANYRKKSDGEDPPCITGCGHVCSGEANTAYFACLESTTCDDPRDSCARMAQITFKRCHTQCTRPCVNDCRRDWYTCRQTETAAHCTSEYSICARDCRNGFTYEAPDTCE